MIGMQYKIILPSDYDMDIIKNRVKNNGHKTDGFESLKFKLYLITEKGTNNNFSNSYCPLYLWKDSKGMNKFLFDGFYDNIISSFGWQHVNIGIPLTDTTSDNIKEIKYLFEVEREIEVRESLKGLSDIIKENMPKINGAEYIVIYSPEKWRYNIFYFIDDLSKVEAIDGVVYSILHVSQGK
ncbi:DUF4865 domain-containing protein [Clostridium zeae]|uniref:DUF4865 domain-containing protein n=1 Tax=Clostridium zeae TaxID=2759022 RepID=A0ABQ1E5A4_9CLOT|nr:DUF4865 family protein [Clostridium zeae]GFZ29908.1 DUF4865 domain-containing protein [Clostridium zeae]